VCHTDLSRGEIAIAAFPPTPALTYPPPWLLFAVPISQGRGQICGQSSPQAVS
jgi:hypothetical protein